jgi:DNA polymerase-3 subunit alpha
LLIRIGAFECLGLDKRKLIWHALFNQQHETTLPNQYKLFKEERKQFLLPDLPVSALENAFDQLELFGFFLIDPFRIGKHMENYVATVASDMPERINKLIRITGYLIAIKNTRTNKGDLMQFGTFIDREGHWIDSVHFPPVARQYPFKGKGLYEIQGIVRDDFGALNIEVQSMQKIPFMDDPRYTD